MAYVSVNPVMALQTAIKQKLPLKIKSADSVELNEQKLRSATLNSHEVLFKANTVFPFNFFPDTVIVDREKLTVINRFFFRVARITSVPIRDILSVEADIGPFFGSVHMSSRYFFTNPHSINFLWRKDALRLQQLLQGYIIAQEQNIDCFGIGKNQLVTMLEDLGQSNERPAPWVRNINLG